MDYKNEPNEVVSKYVRQAAEALVDKVDQATWDKIKEMFHAYYQADVEALLSQHSKKRELEARVDELSGLIQFSGKAEPDEVKSIAGGKIQTIPDRIKQLGGQDE